MTTPTRQSRWSNTTSGCHRKIAVALNTVCKCTIHTARPYDSAIAMVEHLVGLPQARISSHTHTRHSPTTTVPPPQHHECSPTDPPYPPPSPHPALAHPHNLPHTLPHTPHPPTHPPAHPLQVEDAQLIALDRFGFSVLVCVCISVFRILSSVSRILVRRPARAPPHPLSTAPPHHRATAPHHSACTRHTHAHGPARCPMRTVRSVRSVHQATRLGQTFKPHCTTPRPHTSPPHPTRDHCTTNPLPH